MAFAKSGDAPKWPPTSEACSDRTPERSQRLIPLHKWWLFFFLGLLPLLGDGIRKIWGRPEVAAHVRSLLRSDPGTFPAIDPSPQVVALLFPGAFTPFRRWHSQNLGTPRSGRPRPKLAPIGPRNVPSD